MNGRALLVIDMLHDFIDAAGALYCGDHAAAIVPEVRRLLQQHRQEGSLIIFVADSHPVDDLEFRLFPPHCLTGTPGAAPLPGFEPLPGEYWLSKSRYSAFYGTELDDILRRRQINEVHLCGVCTSICVMETCSDLRNRDIKAVVHSQAVADFDQQAHAYALQRMQKILGAHLEP
ncbi:isochorismatase hydrolase [Desulfarculus baarsii DSM 2075]|uniref:Isochorismatase hydrolase n=1 Tax=Desulfarculus baarsii (strain ATCC 33931 / DSM 2075 / LMG 7858 / VKM B-1802 / 2st14) TaxID=644282 RepID=E1QFU9_DESB2|nr:isochorismatase family cysteine hydrolase [Desulfarculus baarsii]ADK84559.1 isochorismatase hydrolase [Desulfarculus baarsii DSM 2075]